VVELDRFGRLDGIGGRVGLFGGLGESEYGHLLPMLFGECGVGLIGFPADQYRQLSECSMRTLLICCCIAAISICF
jgi:hypothetical protein